MTKLLVLEINILRIHEERVKNIYKGENGIYTQDFVRRINKLFQRMEKIDNYLINKGFESQNKDSPSANCLLGGRMSGQRSDKLVLRMEKFP